MPRLQLLVATIHTNHHSYVPSSKYQVAFLGQSAMLFWPTRRVRTSLVLIATIVHRFFWIWRCVGSIHPAPTLRNCPEKRIPDKKDSKRKCKAVYRSATTADRIKQFPVTSTQTELSKALTGSLGQSCRMIWIRSTMRSTKLWAGSPKSEPFRTPMM